MVNSPNEFLRMGVVDTNGQGSFVLLAARDETDEEKRGLVMKNVIHLAQELHITTVVEGVETIAQVDFIRSMHCDLAQGYYFDRPISVEDFEAKYLPIPPSDLA